MSEFGSLNLEDMQGEGARLNAKPGDYKKDSQVIPMPKPKPGQTNIVPVRILPPAKGAKLFQYTRLHMIEGKDDEGKPNGKIHSVHCPKPLINGKWDRSTPCPICDYYNSLYREADKLEAQNREEEADRLKEEARSIKPIQRYYYNAIARQIVDEDGNKKANVGPMIFSTNQTVHKMIVRAIVGDESEAALGDITHPKTGYDLVVKIENRGGKENYPNYDRTAFARETSPLGTIEEIKGWVEGLHDLTKLRVPASVETLEKELARHLGEIKDEDDGFDVDEFRSKFNGGRKSAGRSASTSKPAPASDEDAVNSVVNSDSLDEFTEAAPSTPAPVEDISIEDEDFLKELQGMGDDD